MTWEEKVRKGMMLIVDGCKENDEWAKCRDCPFDDICDALLEHGYTEPFEWKIGGNA